MKYLVIFTFLFGCCEYEMSPREKALNEVMGRSAGILSRKYHIHPAAITLGAPGGDIQYLGLEFQVEGPFSKEKIRRMLIELDESLLEQINSDSELAIYLDDKKLGVENVGITLYMIDSTVRPLSSPNIGTAYIFKGEMVYRIFDYVDGMPVLNKEYRETYEEAKRLLAENSSEKDSAYSE